MKGHFVCVDSCFEILFQRLMPTLKINPFNNSKMCFIYCILYEVFTLCVCHLSQQTKNKNTGNSEFEQILLSLLKILLKVNLIVNKVKFYFEKYFHNFLMI